jgi:hypothetical protein
MSFIKLLLVLALVNFSLAAVCPATPTIHRCGTDSMAAGACMTSVGTGPVYTSVDYRPCPMADANNVLIGTVNTCKTVPGQMTGTCTLEARRDARNTRNGDDCKINGDCFSNTCDLATKKCMVIALNGLCPNSQSCGDGNYCVGGSQSGNASANMGVCMVLPGLGAICVNACAAGHFCGKDLKCAPFLAAGAACTGLGSSECGDARFCDGSVCQTYGVYGDECASKNALFCPVSARLACSNGRCSGFGREAVGTIVSNARFCLSSQAERQTPSTFICVQYRLAETSQDCPAQATTCKYTYINSLAATVTKTMDCICPTSATPVSKCPRDSFNAAIIEATALFFRIAESRYEDRNWRPSNAGERLAYAAASGNEELVYADTCVLDTIIPLSASRITFGAILFVAAFIGMIFA